MDPQGFNIQENERRGELTEPELLRERTKKWKKN